MVLADVFAFADKKVKELVNFSLYNLRITGEDDVYVTSEDDEFISYYPENFRFPKEPNENVCMIVDGMWWIA